MYNLGTYLLARKYLLLLNCCNDIRAGQQKADNCQTHLFLSFCDANTQ